MKNGLKGCSTSHRNISVGQSTSITISCLSYTVFRINNSSGFLARNIEKKKNQFSCFYWWITGHIFISVCSVSAIVGNSILIPGWNSFNCFLKVKLKSATETSILEVKHCDMVQSQVILTWYMLRGDSRKILKIIGLFCIIKPLCFYKKQKNVHIQ